MPQSAVFRRAVWLEFERALLGDGDMSAVVQLELTGDNNLFTRLQTFEDHNAAVTAFAGLDETALHDQIGLVALGSLGGVFSSFLGSRRFTGLYDENRIAVQGVGEGSFRYHDPWHLAGQQHLQVGEYPWQQAFVGVIPLRTAPARYGW